jgi:hypothetical protein
MSPQTHPQTTAQAIWLGRLWLEDLWSKPIMVSLIFHSALLESF